MPSMSRSCVTIRCLGLLVSPSCQHSKWWCGWALLKEVSQDMSRPVRRYDNANLDYLPTQLVSEYIRVVKGMGGLIFQSSRKGQGKKNIVIFDKENARMVNSELRTVGDIEMHFE